MDFSLLLSSYATVWSNPEVLLMTFIGVRWAAFCWARSRA